VCQAVFDGLKTKVSFFRSDHHPPYPVDLYATMANAGADEDYDAAEAAEVAADAEMAEAEAGSLS